jgi:kynurenine aminotransferase
MRSVIGTHLVLAYSSSGPAQDACAIGLREAERIDWWNTNARDVGVRVGKLCHTLDKIGLTVRRVATRDSTILILLLVRSAA